MAKIFPSLNHTHWRVEERIGCTLYYTHHETLHEAIEYCKSNNLEYVIL